MYRTIAQLDAAIDSLVKTRPELCTRVTLNNSIEGRPIHALRLRSGAGTNRRGILMETLDIWMLPCANPDGRNYVMTTDWNWRMNRRDNPGTPCDGVDPNRNCDFLWRVIGPTTVCNPCSSTQGFVGSLPFSEPESQNIHLLCDTHRIDVFVDVHSFSEFVLFPWGHAPTQTTQPLPNFTNLLFGLSTAGSARASGVYA